MFSFSMLKNLTKLEKDYSKYKLTNIINFKNVYSISLYEMLKKELKGKDNASVFIEIENLKNWLGLENKYSRYFDLKKRVLEKACTEINKSKSDIYYRYYERKRGNKVLGVVFDVFSKNSNLLLEIAAAKEEDNSEDILLKEIFLIFNKNGTSISKKEAIMLLKDANDDLDIIEKCLKYSLQKHPDNLIGYVRTLLKNYDKLTFEDKQETFNNFQQRTYLDMDNLEKRLLGWK